MRITRDWEGVLGCWSEAGWFMEEWLFYDVCLICMMSIVDWNGWIRKRGSSPWLSGMEIEMNGFEFDEEGWVLTVMYGVRGGSGWLKTRRRVLLEIWFDSNALMNANGEEWSCMDEDWRRMTMRAYSLPNMVMKRGWRDASAIGIEWWNRWNDTERVPLYHQWSQKGCWGLHSSHERSKRRSDVRWFGCCEGRVRFLFCGAWDEEWWVERRWILMSRVWIERLVSSPPRVSSPILHDSRSKQRISTVLTETVLFCAQRGV